MRKFLLLLLIPLIPIAFFPLWLPHLGTFLTLEDKLQQTDAIFVLRGDDFPRFHKAIDLFNQGYAENLIIAPVKEREQELWDYYKFHDRIIGGDIISKREYVQRVLKYFGKDETGVFISEADTTSTYDEARIAKQWMVQNSGKKLQLVSSGYHMRRAMMIFELVFKGTGIEIFPATAKDPLYDPVHWWRKEHDVKQVALEYFSMGFNLFYHFVLNKTRTNFDSH